jgi:acyl-coenzyme A thioesterase 13
VSDLAAEGFEPADFSGAYLKDGGPYYIKKGEAGWLVGLRLAERHTNYIDIAHGGVLSTLADVALSYQVYLIETPNPVVTTTTLTTNFLNAAKLGDWLIADASIDKLGKRSAHVHGAIRCEGVVLATMSGVFGIFRGR